MKTYKEFLAEADDYESQFPYKSGVNLHQQAMPQKDFDSLIGYHRKEARQSLSNALQADHGSKDFHRHMGDYHMNMIHDEDSVVSDLHKQLAQHHKKRSR